MRDLHDLMNRDTETRERTEKARSFIDQISYDSLNDWEAQFVESIYDRVTSGYSISEAQLERLEVIHDKKKY